MHWPRLSTPASPGDNSIQKSMQPVFLEAEVNLPFPERENSLQRCLTRVVFRANKQSNTHSENQNSGCQGSDARATVLSKGAVSCEAQQPVQSLGE